MSPKTASESVEAAARAFGVPVLGQVEDLLLAGSSQPDEQVGLVPEGEVGRRLGDPNRVSDPLNAEVR
jgi:hypothetical protein